ncbi:AlkA N-terminal domain-containing protein [Salinisphaera aquimarina]|uniref:DNA-3-methyladenine glycosylase II n=1 Tax=Salinisphaera aquimarina TaxID=2094031 RepID=A0ABV7ERA8_9GAMM
MPLHPDQCYEALKARDARFDGLFFVGVSTTGIYCRPVCAVRMPGRDRCSFYSNAAAAEAAGYRPCLRCRPELAPGEAPMDTARLVADLAVARIEAGALSDADMDTLAAEFCLSSRQLRRLVKHEYGVTPIELAQTRRLLMAKQLLTDTQLKVADIAFASGFASVRRFNHLFRSRYRLNPTALRGKRVASPQQTTICLKLGYRPPLNWAALALFLTQRGAPCVEQLQEGQYLRTIRIGACRGWIAVTQDTQRGLLLIQASPSLLPVLAQLRARLRHLFDMDANPTVIDGHLAADTHLAALIEHNPGLRVPGTFDGFELALRAVLGQQISVKAATTLFGRFCTFFGAPIETPFDGLDHLPPDADTLAQASLQQIVERGLTRKRAQTVQALAAASAAGSLRLDPGADLAQGKAALADIPGIGPWTTEYIAMRALADPNAFPASDLVLLKAMDATRPAQIKAMAEAWQPWRAYAAMHLWQQASTGG